MRLPARIEISKPWLAATFMVAVAIWANSLVPGVSSDAASTSVASSLKEAIAALGFAAEWVSNLLVRKMGHLLEYALLGAVAMRAFSPSGRPHGAASLCLIALLAIVPALDETIQLFVPGRSGLATDVLIDWCGCAFGAAVVWLLLPIWSKRSGRRNAPNR